MNSSDKPEEVVESESVQESQEHIDNGIEIDVETYQRLKADFDNFRRRTEAERFKRDGQILSDFAESLLPVLEAFEAGMEYDFDTLKPVYDVFFNTLKNGGLQVINPELGNPFDPTIHEVIESDGNNKDIILEVVRPGYMWDKKLLKPAQVKVG